MVFRRLRYIIHNAHAHAPSRPERRAVPHNACDMLHALPLAMRFRSICGSSSEVKELKSTVSLAISVSECSLSDKPQNAVACTRRHARTGPREP